MRTPVKRFDDLRRDRTLPLNSLLLGGLPISFAPVALSRPRRRGFTLIELLAAMTVLALILVMLGQVFGGSTKAWTSGTRRMDQNIGARAALDFIARDLSGAIILNLPEGSGWQTSLRFLTLAETPDSTHREGRIVEYSLNSTNNIYRLMRSVATATNTINSAYASGTVPSGQGSSDCVAENIAAFQVMGRGAVTVYGSASTNQIPRYVDIFLSILSDADAQQVSTLTSGLQTFVEKSEKRYTTRVYLQNQQGYAIPY